MDSPTPAPWTFAARAAYFGDRLCAFCDRRNPAGAKFCNDCGSPLNLKPCSGCSAINEQLAATCHACGAEYPGLSQAPDPAAVAAATAAVVPARKTRGEPDNVPAATEPLSAGAALRPRSPLLRPSYLALIATILIAGAYAVYRMETAVPDMPAIAAPSVVDDQQAAPALVAVAPAVPEPERAEPELGTANQAPVPGEVNAPVPAGGSDSLRRGSARARQGPAPAVKRASAPQRHLHVAANSRALRTVSATHAGARIAKTRIAQRPAAWQPMQAVVAECGSGLITRIVCDQRARRRFCEGRWGAAPECTSGITNDRGQ